MSRSEIERELFPFNNRKKEELNSCHENEKHIDFGLFADRFALEEEASIPLSSLFTRLYDSTLVLFHPFRWNEAIIQAFRALVSQIIYCKTLSRKTSMTPYRLKHSKMGL